MQQSKKTTNRIMATITALFVVVGSMVVIALAVAPVANASGNCNTRLLGMPTWYDGLVSPQTDTQGDSCAIMNPEEYRGGLGAFVWRIVLNVIEAFLIIVGYASVIMIIVGGFLYMVATGDSSKIASAKKTILNAVIGLIIALSSVAIVNVVKGAI